MREEEGNSRNHYADFERLNDIVDTLNNLHDENGEKDLEAIKIRDYVVTLVVGKSLERPLDIGAANSKI